MGLFQAVFSAVTRSLGKLLNMVFGWATVMMFGKVPKERQAYLSIMAFGSVAWLIALLGIAFPSFATFLLAFVTLPPWIDHTWIRLAMLLAALLIPLLVGGLSLLILEPADRPKGLGARARAVLKGYPFTSGLALALLAMVIFAPIMRVGLLLRRWSTQHVPVIIETEDYEQVVDEVQRALAGRGWKTRRRPASWMLRLPTRLLTGLAGGGANRLVAERLTTLRADRLEVVLHPSDLVISGPGAEVGHARAALAEQLAFSPAYLTWDKDANALEDRLRAVWEELRREPTGLSRGAAAADLARIETDLHSADLPYDEWEVLFRARLLANRGLREPVEPADGPARRRPGRRLLPRAALLGAVALLAWLRLRPRDERG